VDFILGYISKTFNTDAKYFVSGGFWLTSIQIVSVIGALITSVVIANHLDEANYGIYRYIIVIGILLSSISLSGIGQSVFQTASLKHIGFYPVAIKKSLIFGLGITFSALVGSLYYYYAGNYTLALGCLFIAFFQPILNTYLNIFSFLQGRRRFPELTLLQLIKTVFTTSCLLITLYLTEEIYLLIFVYLFSNTLSNYLIHLLYKPAFQKLDFAVFDKYYTYAKSISKQNIIANVANKIDSVIVFQQLGAYDLAIYTIANLLPDQVKASFKNILTLLIPKYAKYENINLLKRNVLLRSAQVFFVFLIVSIFYILISPFIYELLFPKYQNSIFLSQLIALSFPAMIVLVPQSALQGQTEGKKLSKINNYTSVLMIIITLILTLTHGLIGAIIARICSRYVSLFLTYYIFYKYK